MSLLITALIFLILFALQTVLAPFLRLGDAQVDLLIFPLVWTAMRQGPAAGTLAGFLTGGAQDFVSDDLRGVHLFVRCLVGAVTGSLRGKVVFSNPLLQVLLVFAASLVHEVLLILFTAYLPGLGGTTLLLLGRALPSAIFNALLAPFVFALFGRIQKPLDDAPPES